MVCFIQMKNYQIVTSAKPGRLCFFSNIDNSAILYSAIGVPSHFYSYDEYTTASLRLSTDYVHLFVHHFIISGKDVP